MLVTINMFCGKKTINIKEKKIIKCHVKVDLGND